MKYHQKASVSVRLCAGEFCWQETRQSPDIWQAATAILHKNYLLSTAFTNLLYQFPVLFVTLAGDFLVISRQLIVLEMSRSSSSSGGGGGGGGVVVVVVGGGGASVKKQY